MSVLAGQPQRPGFVPTVSPGDRNVLDLNRQIDEEMAEEDGDV